MDELIKETTAYLYDAQDKAQGMTAEEVRSFMTRLLLHLSIEEAKKNG